MGGLSRQQRVGLQLLRAVTKVEPIGTLQPWLVPIGKLVFTMVFPISTARIPVGIPIILV